MIAPTLDRQTFLTSRKLDYFTEPDLIAQTGCDSEQWPEMAVKELCDNSLDAAESHGASPVIAVDIGDQTIRVTDNGPGIPPETLEGVRDLSVRASNKAKYVSPTRGAQGNAFKTLIALPYVLDGTEGRVRVSTAAGGYEFIVRTDAIKGEPVVDLTNSRPGLVKSGTSVEIVWPESWLQLDDEDCRFLQLARAYATFNPHSRITISSPQGDESFEPTASEWKKWLPTYPTASHWYSVEDLCGLIAANLSNGRDCTVRDLVREFAGFAGSAAQKRVLDLLGLSWARLSSLLSSPTELDRDAVAELLSAMQAESREIKPAKLGIIGKEHFRVRFREYQADEDTFEYRSFKGFSDGLPYVVEAAFAVADDEVTRQLLAGINWSPSLNGNPFDWVGDRWDFAAFLQEQQCGEYEPVILAIHVTTPKVMWKDRGKSSVDLDGELGRDVIRAVELVTRKWAKQRKREERDARSRGRRRDALRRRTTIDVKTAAYQVMEDAYQHAAGTTGVAEARQVMYAARTRILEITGKNKLNDSYFTQVLLPDYIAENPETTADWDVVYGARGNFFEPHTSRSVPLGTMAVREYLAKIQANGSKRSLVQPSFSLGHGIFTFGPLDRISAVLFIEKEGFFPLFAKVRLPERYDLALMSSKGVSNTSTRKLIDELAGYARRLERRLPLLVLHDFDAQGFSILGTFTRNMRRYSYVNELEVIDFGLRFEDVDALGLLSEPATCKQKRERLIENGATEREAEFLNANRRVELNSMTSDQMIVWIETKLVRFGITKVIPDNDVILHAARQISAEHRLQMAIDRRFPQGGN